MRTVLTIEGRPKARFIFHHIPSWNDVIAWANQRPRWVKSHKQARFILNQHIQEWRKKAESMALSLRERLFLPGYLIHGRALVVVRVIRGTERKYDVHNAWVKAIFDGFSDAGMWRDDEWAHVPIVIYQWGYDTTGKGQRFEIELYELDDFTMNGVAQVLPEGRDEK